MSSNNDVINVLNILESNTNLADRMQSDLLPSNSEDHVIPSVLPN